MQQEIDNPSLTLPTDCCDTPAYPTDDIVLTPKLHQSRGYIEATCEACNNTHHIDYYLSHKEANGERHDKDAMNLPTPDDADTTTCNHYFGLDGQTAVLNDTRFFVRSECQDCGLIVHDVFKQQ